MIKSCVLFILKTSVLMPRPVLLAEFRGAQYDFLLSPYFACKMGGCPSEARGRGAGRRSKRKKVKTMESIQVLLRKYNWIIKTLNILGIIPHIAFGIWLFIPTFTNKPVYETLYPPVQNQFLGWVFLGVLASAFPLLLLNWLKNTFNHRILWGLFSVAVKFTYFFILLTFLAILFLDGVSENKRIAHEDKTYAVTTFLDHGEHFCLYEYESIFSFDFIDCFYVTIENETPEMLFIDEALLVFIDGNLRYLHGENPFNNNWIDIALFDGKLFNLRYTEAGSGEVVYELYKCEVDNTSCVRESFYFKSDELEHAELQRPVFRPSSFEDGLQIHIGGDLYEDLIYTYGEEPTCHVEGCELK